MLKRRKIQATCCFKENYLKKIKNNGIIQEIQLITTMRCKKSYSDNCNLAILAIWLHLLR